MVFFSAYLQPLNIYQYFYQNNIQNQKSKRKYISDHMNCLKLVKLEISLFSWARV